MPVENQEGRSVEVLGLPEGVDEELLSLYFENKRRSGGGPLTSVEKEGDRALLVFEEAEVAARVLSKGHHVLHNTELTVRKPPLKDPWRLLLRGVNANINLELVELYVENMLGMEMDSYNLDPLLERGLVLVHFQQQLSQDFQQLSAKISKKPLDGSKITLEQIEQTDTILVENLPPGISTVTLTSYLESTGAGNHKVKEINMTSPSTARVSLVDFESVVHILNRPHKLENAELNMRPYFAFLQPTESLLTLNSGNEPLDASTDSARPNLSSLTPVGADSQSSQQMASPEVAHTAAEVAEEVMEDLTKDTEPLTSHVAIPDPLKLSLFRISTLPQDIVQAYPNFDIKIRDDGVYIAGPDRLTMEQLKNAILEFLGSIAQTQFPVDEETAQFLTNQAVKQLLLETMKERGLPSIYNVVGNVIAVTSLSVNFVNQACSLLKSLFCSFSIPVDREYECMLYSEELSGFLQSLGFCSARVSAREGEIEVMTLKGMESDMKEKIVTFLSTPIERETVISMEPGRLKYIQLHHHQLMADMDQVSIVPLEAEDVCGLKIRGNAMACQMAAEVLQSVVSSICTRTITSNQPGVSRFLLEDEGPSILAEITAKFQVYISMDKVYWKRIPNEDIFEAAWKLMSQQSFQKVSLDGAQDMEVLTQTGLIEEAKRIVSVIDEKMDVAPSTSDKTDDMEDEDLYTSGEPTGPNDQDDDDLLIINAPCDLREMGGATAGNPLLDEAMGRRAPANLEEDAQMSLAIQYSMEYTRSQAEEEDEELQKVLELSMKTANHEGPAIPAKQTPKQVKDVCASMEEEIKAINTSQISVFAGYTSDLIRTDIALAKKITLRQVEEKLEQKGLKNMSELHKKCLEVIKRKHAVEIKIQGNMVIIRGFKDFVSNALPDIKLVLRKMSSATSDADVLKTLQWVWHDAAAATPYAPDTTVFIETAWRMKQKKINLLLNNQPHIINFEKMEEYNVASGKSVKISRKMLSLVDLTTNVSEEDYSLLSSMPEVARVDEDSDEFQEVVKEFYESIQKYHSKIRIIKVEKLMNRLLYKQYQLKKASIMQSATEPEIERTLYHGTSESSVKEICIHGFNRSFCGKNATVYGQGVYFAVNSALSVQEQYSPPNAEGYKFVFVGKVLTGDYTKGDHSMKTAPLKESDDIPLRYDSVADNITTPTMFIIFNDTQAYPQYLITCQKIHR